MSVSPVGVVVLDAVAGTLKSFNRETQRIFDSLRSPDQTQEEFLGTMTFRRADGREISMQKFPMAELLSVGETVWAKKIIISVPDGRSVTVLLNATSIHSNEGTVELTVSGSTERPRPLGTRPLASLG